MAAGIVFMWIWRKKKKERTDGERSETGQAVSIKH